MRRRLQTSLALKLRLATLVPLVAAIAACWLLGTSLITTRLVSEAQERVNGDLAAAHRVLDHELARLTEIVTLTALTPQLAADAAGRPLTDGLQLVKANQRLAFLTVIDRYGLVVQRAGAVSGGGERIKDDEVVRRALGGVANSGILLLSPGRMGREDPTLPARARIELRATPHAAPYLKGREERGLFLVAAAPIRDAAGAVSGVVEAGILLNGATELIDAITQLVYRQGSGGVATIFLDGVRVATSVRDEAGERAIGSLLSESVRDAVLLRGEPWRDRAFVYNDWYVSAYLPLRDPAGHVVGALYAGTPEAPFKALRLRVNLYFSLIMICGALVGLALSGWIGSRLARPIRTLAEGARRVAAGEHFAPLKVDSHDEVAELADEFNTMTVRLREREEEIGALNRTLEEKVALRGAELERKGAELLAAQRELAHSERLAAVGLLAAGVAHEINNPLLIIRGNAELAQMALPPAAEPQEELATILRQTTRIERIVASLRTLSRPAERHPAPVPLTPLFDEILQQISHQHPLAGIEVVRGDRGQGAVVEADGDQLRQVLTNIVLNALQAMDGTGELTVTVDYDEEGRCCIAIADRGPGLAAGARERLFTPFYTTKPQGSGLGLAVSYGIVRDHGGTIEAHDRPGGGAVFTVTLPAAQPPG